MNDDKISPNENDVNAFIDGVLSPLVKKDSEILLELIGYITDMEPKMWGATDVGFGKFHYKYEDGSEGDWFFTGFSPGEHRVKVHIIPEFDRCEELLSQLGTYEVGISCLYIKKLADIDIDVLSQLIGESVGYMRRTYL